MGRNRVSKPKLMTIIYILILIILWLTEILCFHPKNIYIFYILKNNFFLSNLYLPTIFIKFLDTATQ